MKLFRLLDGFQKSTRITIMGCACFLVTTALILVFLMFFPIIPEEKHVITMSPVTTEPSGKETQTYPVVEFDWEDMPHTLSTWSAGVDGFTRSLDEFTATESETQTTGTEETTTAMDKTETGTETDDTDMTYDTDVSGIYTENPPMPQTSTETVDTAVTETETSFPEETETLPVVTEAAATPAPEPEDEE